MRRILTAKLRELLIAEGIGRLATVPGQLPTVWVQTEAPQAGAEAVTMDADSQAHVSDAGAATITISRAGGTVGGPFGGFLDRLVIEFTIRADDPLSCELIGEQLVDLLADRREVMADDLRIEDSYLTRPLQPTLLDRVMSGSEWSVAFTMRVRRTNYPTP